jgi:hypothetical protein
LHTREDVFELTRAVGRHEDRDRSSDDLFRGVAIEPLGALVPTQDGAVEAPTQDGVLAGIDEGRQMSPQRAWV